MKLKLHWQILIAMLLGSIIGYFYQSAYSGKPSGLIYSILVSFGEIFIRMLRMVIAPLVFASLVSGVASIGPGKSLGRIGFKTFSYYIITTLIAILIGLFLANLTQPGVNANIPVNSSMTAEQIKSPPSPAEILIRLVPINPLQAIAEGDMLGIIFFALILGVAITQLKDPSRTTMQNLFQAGFNAMTQVTEFVIKSVPLGVLGLIVRAVSTVGFDMFRSLGVYWLTIVLGLSLHLFVILPLIFYLLTRINPLLHFRATAPAMITAFSTSSSNATLPVTMSNVENNAGVSSRISSFVLPLGATVNMNGTALYECLGVIFISQILGIELTLTQQIIVVFTSLLAAIGCAGIPSAGLVVIFIVTQAVGFRDADVAVIIGAMLSVDRPLDMFRTVVNITGDSFGAVIIAKSEGETNLFPGMMK